MKKTILTAALCCFALAGFAQGCCSKGYEVKAENAYTHYNVRWATGPEDAKHYTTYRLRIFSLLANVADVKSLVIHPATTTHSQLSPEELEEQHIYPSTVRLSIGIENIDDLIEALDEAFTYVK